MECVSIDERGETKIKCLNEVEDAQVDRTQEINDLGSTMLYFITGGAPKSSEEWAKRTMEAPREVIKLIDDLMNWTVRSEVSIDSLLDSPTLWRSRRRFFME